MLYARLVLAFFYYLLRPTTRRHSPFLFIIILLLCLMGLFFIFFREFPLLQLSSSPLETPPSEEAFYVNIERELLQKNQATVHQLLDAYPTSRDLWLYNGWISLSLTDMEEVTKAVEMLTLIDPNNPQVRFFLEQL